MQNLGNLKVLDIVTKEVISIQRPPITGALQYPSDWFDKNRSKPPCKVPNYNHLTFQDIQVRAVAVLRQTEPNPMYLIQFLFNAFQTIKDESATAWKSYHIEIGVGELTPLSLLEISREDLDPTSGGQPIEVVPTTVTKYLLGVIVGLYRLHNAHDLIKSTVAERIEKIIGLWIPPGFQPIPLNQDSPRFMLVLHSNLNFTRLICALDMFLHRFPNNEFAKLRVGTIVTRYAGCSILSDLIYFSDLFGKELDDMAEWAFHNGLHKEYKQIFKTQTEEMNEIYSYFPYMMGMGLSEKSPYSASSNPHLHFLIHCVGIMLGMPRSINSQLVGTIPVPHIFANAALIFFGFSPEGTMQVRFYKEERGNRLLRETTGASDDDEPPKDPAFYFEEYRDNGFRLKPHQIRVIKDIVARLENTREGTIGKWFKDNAIIMVEKQD
nr:putative N protein [Aksy-Durug Melophagus sigmavirus]